MPKTPIKDDRKISAVTNQPLKLNRSGEYDSDTIKHIALAAQRLGNDPYTALAIGMQESGLGTNTAFNAQKNYGQVNLSKWGNNPELLAAIKANPDLDENAVAMNFVLKSTRDKYSKEDELHQIQGYNGFLLKPNNDIGSTKMYGIDLTKYPQGYDLYKNPLYAKSVLDIRENVLKKNKSVIDMIEQLKQPAQKGVANPDALSTGGITIAAADAGNGQKKLSFMKDGKVFKEVAVAAEQFNNPATRKDLLKTALTQ